jgi:hypothetical protein
MWSSRPAGFLRTSTVHAVTLRKPRIFDLRHLGVHTRLRDVLEEIDYPENISPEQVRRIYNYLHNRVIGKAKGGEFKYKVYDPNNDWEEADDDEVPLSILRPQTLISYFARDDFDDDPSILTTSNVEADTFIFIDAPAVQKAVRAMGYDVIAYIDAFGGAEYAVRDLFGMDEEELLEQEGVWDDFDIDYEEIIVHESFRILNPGVIDRIESMPVAEAAQMLRND